MKLLTGKAEIAIMLSVLVLCTSLRAQNLKPDCSKLNLESLTATANADKTAHAKVLYACAKQFHAEGAFSIACNILDQAYVLVHDADEVTLEKNILVLLHTCHAALGHHAEAYRVSLLVAEIDTQLSAVRKRQAMRDAQTLQKERAGARLVEIEAMKRQQKLQLLQSENEINNLKLEVAEGWLDRERSNSDKDKQRLELVEKDRQIQAGIIEREALIRNVLIAAAFLSLIIGFLVYRRLKDHRRASELKAEIAEARATSLETEKRRSEFESRKRFTRQLIESQEQERKRIAADLHDGLGQDLLVIKNRLTLARREQEKGADPTREMEEISLAVNSSLQNIRGISRNLRPSQLDRLGLTSSIQSMLSTLQESCTFDLLSSVDKVDGFFSTEREIDVYRIVQEGMNNIIKHAHASMARVEVACFRDEVKISISDNGRGFSSTVSAGDSRSQAIGFGLQGMNERAQILGGVLTIDSIPGNGTTVTVILPIQRKHDPEIHNLKGVDHAEERASH